MNRFFVEPGQVGNENIEITDKDDIKHIAKVLRLKPGDKIEISDSSEFEYLVEIVSMPKAGDSIKGPVGGLTKIVGKILDKQAFRGEVYTKVTLFQCLPKQDKMKTIIQKSVELGVHKIVPVFCSRTVVKGKKAENDKTAKGKVERWNKISAEAVKQCKRGVIPLVGNPVKLSEMIKTLNKFDLVLFPYENENGATMKTVLQGETRVKSSKLENKRAKNRVNDEIKIALIIGPEGGFSDQEATLIKEAGGKSLSLGKTVLRTETAGITALAMIMYELEL